MELNYLIDKIIDNQKENIVKKVDFCCGRCDFNNPVNIIENDKIKIIFNDEGNLEIRRLKNENPVILRDEYRKIYRQHGEWFYLKKEMYKLAGLEEEILKLKSDFKYD